MIKKIIKIFLILGLFFSFILNTFALDAELQVDKQQVNINDVFNLRLQVKSSEGGEIKVKSIKGIENFEKIGQSQSQSSSTSIVMINGKTKTQAITTVNLDLTLRPLKNGEFEIGPAVLQNGTGIIETNKVKIKVSGNKSILLNRGNTNNLQNNNTTSPLAPLLKGEGEQKSLPPIRGELEGGSQNNYDLYLLLTILLISGIGFYILYKNTPPNPPLKGGTKKFQNGNFSPLQRGDAGKAEGEEEIDFEEKKQVKIIYPKADEENFEEKIDKVFRQKLQNIYNIKNIDSLTFEEIKDFIDKNKLQDFEKIISNLNKIKYSNIIGDKTKIIELVKEF